MNKKALIQAALFVSDKPLSLKKLTSITNSTTKEVDKILKEIQMETEKEDSGIQLMETPEGYNLIVKPIYRPYVASIAPFSDLSEGMKRTLALIAAKQPIKQSLIVRYQGNKAYNYIESLVKKGLIKAERFGRTKILTTTENFERYFGKPAEAIKKILNEKV